MISNDTIIKVRNRKNGSTGYSVADLGIRRHFSPGETKEVTMEEMRKLSYAPGGRYVIENCLMIMNEEAIEELLHGVEPEYFYTEKEVKELLEKGSLNQLLDCLDYAPDGVISLVKSIAVDIKLNDMSKREAIKDKLGFDVSKAIEVKIESETAEETKEVSSRRAAPIVTEKEKEEGAARRTTAPRYNVVVD
jgi:hypothetical protein